MAQKAESLLFYLRISPRDVPGSPRAGARPGPREGVAITIYIIASVVAVGLLQHVMHECAHILMARTQGVKVLRVHWFTYSRVGTRGFYREEPSTDQDPIATKWGWIALGGLIGTTLIRYLLTAIYLWGPWNRSAWSVSVLVFGSVIFLITDRSTFSAEPYLGLATSAG